MKAKSSVEDPSSEAQPVHSPQVSFTPPPPPPPGGDTPRRPEQQRRARSQQFLEAPRNDVAREVLLEPQENRWSSPVPHAVGEDLTVQDDNNKKRKKKKRKKNPRAVGVGVLGRRDHARRVRRGWGGASCACSAKNKHGRVVGPLQAGRATARDSDGAHRHCHQRRGEGHEQGRKRKSPRRWGMVAVVLTVAVAIRKLVALLDCKRDSPLQRRVPEGMRVQYIPSTEVYMLFGVEISIN